MLTTDLSKFLFHQNANPAFLANEVGEILEVNEAAIHYLGFDRKFFDSVKIQRVFIRSQRILVGSILKSLKSGKRQSELRQELFVLNEEAEQYPVICSFNLLQDDGETHFLITLKDISSRSEDKNLNGGVAAPILNRKNKALGSSEELYRIVSRNFPNGVISVFDRDFNYLFAEGKELYRMGITSEKLVGTNYLDRLPLGLHDEIKEKLSGVLEGKNQTFEISHKDNHYILNASGLESADGTIDRILLVEINNTQQKRAEKEIKRAFEKERQLNELKSRFVSMASHEFRTPLSTILSSINLMLKYLEHPNGKEKIKKHGQKIASSVKNLTSILNDFLSIDKLEEGKVELHPSKFNFSQLVRNMVDDLEEHLKEGQEFQLVLPDDQPVFQDPNILRNVIINLLTNAIKYSHENQEILIKVWEIKNRVFLEVQDYGIGIPEEEQAQLFERFFRAKNAFNLQGTGLGLNIVKRYVDLIHGKISFFSREQEGTTFTVQFPKKFKNEENISH